MGMNANMPSLDCEACDSIRRKGYDYALSHPKSKSTSVDGCAITVPALLAMGAKKVKQEIDWDDIYKLHTTNHTLGQCS